MDYKQIVVSGVGGIPTYQYVLRLRDNYAIFTDTKTEAQTEYLQWLSEGNTPEPADIPPEPTYQELRATEYNLKSTGEQFGMQYDDAVNGTTTWIDWQDDIKARIPK